MGPRGVLPHYHPRVPRRDRYSFTPGNPPQHPLIPAPAAPALHGCTPGPALSNTMAPGPALKPQYQGALILFPHHQAAHTPMLPPFRTDRPPCPSYQPPQVTQMKPSVTDKIFHRLLSGSIPQPAAPEASGCPRPSVIWEQALRVLQTATVQAGAAGGAQPHPRSSGHSQQGAVPAPDPKRQLRLLEPPMQGLDENRKELARGGGGWLVLALTVLTMGTTLGSEAPSGHPHLLKAPILPQGATQPAPHPQRPFHLSSAGTVTQPRSQQRPLGSQPGLLVAALASHWAPGHP